MCWVGCAGLLLWLLGSTVLDLLEYLGTTVSPPKSAFWVCQPIEFYWHTDEVWYPAIVNKVHSDGRVDLRFEQTSWSDGTLEDIDPWWVRPRDFSSSTTESQPARSPDS